MRARPRSLVAKVLGGTIKKPANLRFAAYVLGSFTKHHDRYDCFPQHPVSKRVHVDFVELLVIPHHEDFEQLRGEAFRPKQPTGMTARKLDKCRAKLSR